MSNGFAFTDIWTNGLGDLLYRFLVYIVLYVRQLLSSVCYYLNELKVSDERNFPSNCNDSKLQTQFSFSVSAFVSILSVEFQPFGLQLTIGL